MSELKKLYNDVIVKDEYYLIPKTGLRVPYYNYDGEIQNKGCLHLWQPIFQSLSVYKICSLTITHLSMVTQYAAE